MQELDPQAHRFSSRVAFQQGVILPFKFLHSLL
jgi:hypothetical protein